MRSEGPVMTWFATADEVQRRDRVMDAILEAVHQGQRIRLPDFDREKPNIGAEFALQTVGIEPNNYGGTVGPCRYQFEGEEDLLHLIVVRTDNAELSVAEAREVAAFLLPGVPTALIWLRPGVFSQHFYLGHDELATHLRR
jgi:hypothetical protein